MKAFVRRWLITALAVQVAAKTVHGIECDSPTSLLVASLVLGLLNAFLRPLMLLLALPLLLLTLGLFVLVINAGLLYLVGRIVKDFHVAGFWPALWGSLVISFVSILLGGGKTTVRGQVNVRRGRPASPPSSRPPDQGGGPVIDV